MKATINRKIFLQHATAIPPGSSVSLTASNGILSVTCFTSGTSFNIPAYIIQEGQAYLNPEEWSRIVEQASNSQKNMIDINI